MNNCHGSTLTRRQLVLLVVVLQVGIFWLAAHVASPPVDHGPAGPPIEGRTIETGASKATLANAHYKNPFPPSLPATVEQGSGLCQTRWLPPLTDPTRMVLASFQSLPQESGIPPATSGPKLEPLPDTLVEPPMVQPAPLPDLPSPAASAAPGSADSLREPAGPPAKAVSASNADEPSGPDLVPQGALRPGLELGDWTPPPVAPTPQSAIPITKAAPPEAAEPLPPKAPEEALSGDAKDPEDAAGAASPLRDKAPGVPYRRSVALEMIAREADAHTRRAFDLASRGAYFSARSEFIVALRLLAQGLDTDGRTSAHSDALALGLAALKEADDFIPTGSRLEADLDLPGIIAGHRTPVLQGAAAGPITPLVALQRYLTFAQEQLATATGREIAGSMALQGMGKLHAVLGERASIAVKAAEPKAMVFFQAALLVDPRNYMASNDLGVLLGRAGHYAEARAAIVHSLSIQPHAIGWRNLALVDRQLGRTDLALAAARQWQLYRQAEIARRGPVTVAADLAVQWVPPEALARTNADTPVGPPPNPAPSTVAPGKPPAAPATRQAANRGWPSRQTPNRQ
jgi:tetratricopeptide (TPR) repeat protein